MKKIIGSIGLFALIAILSFTFLHTSIPVESQSDSTDPQDPKLIMAAGYAKHYGVSIDEALLRLDLQEAFPDLEPQLEDNEEATFGGLWIQHEPEYKIVVAFTHNGENMITKYSDYIPANVAPYIEVRTVEMSVVDLLAEQNALLSSLNKVGISADSRIDVKNNCVSADIVRGDESKFRLMEHSGKIEIPEKLKINFVDGLAKPTTNIYGGLTLDDYYSDPYNTAGFSVVTAGGTKRNSHHSTWYT